MKASSVWIVVIFCTTMSCLGSEEQDDRQHSFWDIVVSSRWQESQNKFVDRRVSDICSDQETCCTCCLGCLATCGVLFCLSESLVNIQDFNVFRKAIHSQPRPQQLDEQDKNK